MIRAHTVSLGKKKETKQEAGRVLPTVKGFENGVPDHIFLSFFPWFVRVHTRYHWEKKETKQEAGFYLG